MEIYTIIKQPLTTEKGSTAKEQNKYFFKVDVAADKPGIKRAVETLFKVKVTGVQTLIQRGKTKRHGRSTGRTSTWKKAIVKLQQGQKIEFFEGV